jgi:hypothetical protein
MSAIKVSALAAEGPEPDLEVRAQRVVVLGGHGIGHRLRLGLLDGAQGLHEFVDGLGHAVDAGLLHDGPVAHDGNRAGRPRQPELLALVVAQGEQARIHLAAEVALAIDLVEVDHAVGAGKLRQPALGQLHHIERLPRAQAQQDVLLHLRPGKSDHIELDVRVGLAKRIEHGRQGRLARRLIVRPADIGQCAGLGVRARCGPGSACREGFDQSATRQHSLPPK